MSVCKPTASQQQPPASIFPSALVYYYHSCGNRTLSFVGTLPSFIEIDDINSRLIGKIGMSYGASQFQATVKAQQILNKFAQINLGNGNLFCAGNA